MLLLANMESFVEVARSRNFGRAAKALGITPSTLTRRIAALERELGIVLIRRSTRSFALTESGEKLLERSGQLVEQAERLKEEFRVDFSIIAGHLRVGTPSDLAVTLAAPMIAEYCRTNDQTLVDIIATQGSPDLLADRLDVAFTVAHQAKMPDSSFPVRKIGSFPRMLFASNAYLREKGTPETPQELYNHQCIRYLAASVESKWDLYRGRKRETVAVSGICSSSSVLASALAAREHLGVAMLPQHLACHPTYGGDLVRVLPEWEGTPVVVFAVTPDRVLPAKVEALIKMAKAHFAERLAALESSATQGPPRVKLNAKTDA